MALGVYLAGVLVFLSSFLVQLVVLRLKSSRLEFIRDGNYRIYELQRESPPFSFFRNIYINPSLYDYDTYEQIVLHEKLHVDQKHYLDKLLGELLLVLFWFNPFVWGIRNQISNNMEYQVDDEMLHSGIDRESYQMSLLKVSARIHPLSFTNNYNQTLLEKRIEMMNSKKSSMSSSWRYLLILPIFSLTIFSFNPIIGGDNDAISPKESFMYDYDHEEAIRIEGSFKNRNTENTFVLANITGKVEIIGHDKEDIQVSAFKSISAPTEEQINKGVEEIKVGKLATDDYFAIYLDSPYSKFNEEEDSFSYNENCGGAPCFSYTFRIDYTIKLPRNTNLVVQNVNGGEVRIESIRAHNIRVKHITGSIALESVSGNADLETVSGDIKASFSSVPTGVSSFKTISGNLSIAYPKTFSGKIDQKAGDGSFSTDFPIEERFMRKQKVMKSFNIGDNEGTFRFETTSGDIELKSNGL
ncbi:DUF4097 family beta strand repeat-containing protein [Ulvibacterium sp.]|uniref:DUF4097 family beta strand repeat-containing protein n=1 Tax=Ulvibacterium sp. TaxID=2665914 RepID=UPI0026126152|nr:DUF4097 family beta strand repeat-containing protein [Ulvibacterium sp.]